MSEDLPVEYTLVKSADLKFDSRRITIVMPEGMMALQRKPMIAKYFNRLFQDCFGLSINTVIEYVKRPEKEEESP